MKAAVIQPHRAGSVHLEDIPMPELPAEAVRVQVLEVGIDGTDLDINRGAYGEAPPGQPFLVATHESLGVVTALGENAQGLEIGDLVVATVRRPCPEACANCAAGAFDFCQTGHYLERGIKGLDGYAAPCYTERPDFLVRVPEALRRVAVLLEPLSVAEKGIRQAYAVQSRLVWQPRRALVVGAGSLGLLVAFVLRLSGLETHVANRGPATRPKARRVSELGAHYVQLERESVTALATRVGGFDLVVEATGVSALLFEALGALAVNGALINLGLSLGQAERSVPSEALSRRMVLNNQIMLGSVNSHRQDFLQGVTDMQSGLARFPGWMERLISRRLPLDAFAQAFQPQSEDVKVVLEMPGP